jgi:hypothetical protein
MPRGNRLKVARSILAGKGFDIRDPLGKWAFWQGFHMTGQTGK